MAHVKVADKKAIAPETSNVPAETLKVVAPKIKVKRDWGKLVSLDIPEEALRKYPDMAFAWVLRNDDKIMAYQNMGYTYPQLTNAELKSPDFMGRDTSYIMKGDLILMMHPLDEEEDRLNYWKGICEQRMSHFNKSDRAKQVKDIHSTASIGEEVNTERKETL